MTEKPPIELITRSLLGNSDKKSAETRTKLAGLGIFINLIWILSIFFRPLNSNLFLFLGLLGLLITISTRIQSRHIKNDNISGGSIVGYVVSWFIVYLLFPTKSTEIFSSSEFVITVNQLLLIFLVLSFVVWFLIPSKELSEILFNLSPRISYFILNLWKLIVIFEIITMIEGLKFLSPLASTCFLLLGFIELILQYFHVYKIPIADFILNPYDLALKIFDGPAQALKWSILTIVFILLDIFSLNLISAGLIAFSTAMGFISFFTVVTRTSLASGILGSKVTETMDEGKILIPKIFNELKQIEPADLSEFYQVISEKIEIKQKSKIIYYQKGDILLKVPFTPTLEETGGVFLAELKARVPRERKRKRTSQKIFFTINETGEKSSKKERKFRNISIGSLNRIKKQDWDDIIRNKKVKSLESKSVIRDLGFESQEEFERMVQRGLEGAVSIQENIRDRIRGVPVTVKSNVISKIKVQKNQLVIPEELIKQYELDEDQEIEIIPGKEEFLFYARIKQKKK